MAKRRTREQKAKSAQKRVSSNWQSGTVTFSFDPDVNSQSGGSATPELIESRKIKSTQNSAQNLDLISIRKNIYKSLILASLILGSELVIYSFWK